MGTLGFGVQLRFLTLLFLPICISRNLVYRSFCLTKLITASFVIQSWGQQNCSSLHKSTTLYFTESNLCEVKLSLQEIDPPPSFPYSPFLMSLIVPQRKQIVTQTYSSIQYEYMCCMCQTLLFYEDWEFT